MAPRKPRRKPHVQATFGPRGQALWDDLSPRLDVARRVVLDEACRLADRLDHFARVLDGDGETWATIREAHSEGMPAQLIVSSVVGEARMTATVLRQLIAELTPASPAAAEPAGDASTGGSASDELRARRAARLAERGTAS